MSAFKRSSLIVRAHLLLILILWSSLIAYAQPAQQALSNPSGSTIYLKPGISIILYVNSADKIHFESVVNRAIYLRDNDPRFRLSAIFHVGDYRNVSDSLKDSLQKRAIYLEGISHVPLPMAAETSPLWLIRTPDADHFVEGPVQIERCLDESGGYREPTQSKETPVPSPTAGVKQF
jgi:hypothetical protein